MNNKTAEQHNSYVYKTSDYQMFKQIDGNRTRNPVHISRLKKSMSQNYLFTVIIVNEKYEIIDGQHRFECVRDLKLPLNYIVCRGYGLEEVHILNQNSKTWNADDYLEGYCNLGIDDYIIYKKFKDKYQFGHNECMTMLSGASTRRDSLFTDFKGGNFKVTGLKNAVSVSEKIWSLSNIYPGFRRRSFVYAILYLLNKPEFIFEEFVNKLKIQPSALTDCPDTKRYIALIEDIYNYRRRDKVSLRY